MIGALGRDPFIFATGIENSYPRIATPDGGSKRVDEMAKCGHYERWRDDFQLVGELGIRHLRYGPPYYRTHLAPGRYDWSFSDETFNELRRLKIEPIADLCHFGVPDWVGGFQDPRWPRLFAEYARSFAERYPWVRLYTPINEIFIAATFSAQFGWWNERCASDRDFVTAVKHLSQANVLAMEAILEAQPAAVFVQSESSEYFHAANPECREMAAFYNQKRFLALDLTYGYPISAAVYQYLLDQGMTRDEYEWFLRNRVKAHCVMGNDYYVTNEHLVHADSSISPSGEILGYYVITHQYYARYGLPVMHTETNLSDGDAAVRWLRKEWANVHLLRQDGVPVVGFTWYSLTDQVDWDSALREDAGHVNPLGLYDLDRKIRPVGEAYRGLINQWRPVLPTEARFPVLSLPADSSDERRQAP
ncbi:MAG: family 1 glycosylhydrolase [Chloroflexota bacterium]|nr:family 1 glycosylhydrolase [Chloroflexota bacterium]